MSFLEEGSEVGTERGRLEECRELGGALVRSDAARLGVGRSVGDRPGGLGRGRLGLVGGRSLERGCDGCRDHVLGNVGGLLTASFALSFAFLAFAALTTPFAFRSAGAVGFVGIAVIRARRLLYLMC